MTLSDSVVAFGASWGDNDEVVFGGPEGLQRVPAAGGTAEAVTIPDPSLGVLGYIPLRVLPGSRAVLFTIADSTEATEWQLAALSLESGESHTLTGGMFGTYASTGHLIFLQATSQAGAPYDLMAAPFDPIRLEMTGALVPMVENVRNFALSNEGSLVYEAAADGTRAGAGTLVWVDRDGREEPLGADARPYSQPRLSPDGRQVAVTVGMATGRDIWVFDLARGSFTRLTFGEATDYSSVWTPDGQQVVFTSGRDGALNLFQKLADGTGQVDRLTTKPNRQSASSLSPDGTVLVFTEQDRETSFDIHVLPLDGERAARPLLNESFVEFGGVISPDGRWLAYHSNETGMREVYVRPFPEVGGGKWQVSTGGGQNPVWRANGRELFYRRGTAVLAVPVTTDPTFSPGIAEVVFEGSGYASSDTLGGGGRHYDVSPDGQRFLMIKDGGTAEDSYAPSQIHVVLNWFEELKARVPTGR